MSSRIDIKKIFFAVLLCLILPNILFVLITYWTGDDRPLFNIDYLLPLLCFTQKNKLIKVIGVFLFVLIFLADLLLIALQHFPNIHFRDIFYLIGFTFSGPKSFLIYGTIISILLLIEIILSWLSYKKITDRDILTTALCLTLLNIGYYYFQKKTYEDTLFYNNDFAGSNTFFLLKNQEANFSNLLGGDLLKPTPYEQATKPWHDALKNHQPLNKKLLLIIVESWGQPLDNAIQEDILKNLKAKTNHLEYINQGSMLFRGLTVEGELRELCQLHPETVDLYQIKTGFQNCLPKTLDKLGYETRAIHGGSGLIYGREKWYPKAGFKEPIFQQDLNIPTKCVAFDGTCDWDILPLIKQYFAQDKKLFNYWLTLTSHQDYYEKDIHNKRFNCSKYHIPDDAACHNLMLQAQLFDYIAEELITSPQMRGVEVIIVGDHPPPLFKANQIALFKTKQMDDASVGWVHFKIKD